MSIITLNQFGLIPGHNILIDSLSYQYQTSAGYNYTNKLRSVTDASFNSQNLGDFKDNESTASNDYLYNRNGNLVRDNNKYIAFVNYNHLNLPVSINIANHTGVTGGVIQYKYDALGNKQEKIVTELVNNTSCTTTTYYMGEVVYEKREGYPGAEGLVKLQLISNEEGRSIYDTANPAFQYQYMMKDHLGNVRMLLNAEDQPQLSYPDCDFEDDHASVNSRYYLNTNTYLVTPPPEFTTSQGTGAQCQLIKNNDAPVGVGKLLKVMATDEVGVKADYYIPTTTVDNTGAPPLQNLIGSIISILNNTSYTGSMHGAGTAVGESFAHDVPLNNLLQQQGSTTPSNNVKAYLNILFFDAQFNFICQQSQYQQLSVMGSSQTVTLLGSSMIKAPANGYAYIYVSNESRNPVYIDNFQVVHKPGRIVEETHYYPFGLVMSGISSQSAGSLKNKENTFQGQRFDDDLGLNWVQFKWRNHDPQIGRFVEIDPLADKYVYNSTYAFSENHVTAHVELEGLEKFPINREDFPAGASKYLGVKLIQNDNVRKEYVKEVSKLAPGDKEARANLKEEARVKTPEPFKTIVEEGRPMSGEKAKVSDPNFKGNATKANAEVNDVVKAGGVIGKGLVVVAAANSITNIAQSSDPLKQTVVEASSWAGAIQGGTTGAQVGSMFGPYGAIAGGLVGSIGGGIAGSAIGQAIANNFEVGKEGTVIINGAEISNTVLMKR